jgi:P-type E1-E2 ATPase
MFKFMSARRLLASHVEMKVTDVQQQHTPPAKPPTVPPAAKRGEVVTVAEGETIPFDGKILEGVALVDESALVGVSTPALLSDETGRNNVIAGTLVVEGTLKIQRV